MGVYNTATNTWEHDTAYTYDSMSRLATLASLGKSATYTRINSSNRLRDVAFANNVGAPNIGYAYDYQLRLTGKGGISRGFSSRDEVQYTSGDNHYGYDDKGQLARWGIGVINEGVLIGTSTEYDYDEIGNVLSGSLTYNNVNQPSNLVYDADGNMTKNGSTLYTYDAENRLKTMGTSGNYKEFFYDYAGRCFKRQTVRKTTTTSVTVNEYLIYDKTKIIAVLNGSASAITEKYTWQPPTSGDADVLLWDATSVYLTDCNKNIVKRYYYVPDYDTCTVDTYSYTPFGMLTSGSATPFRFGFSSEESYNGLYLYLYRAYNPTLKRWLTRDPIEENGGVNLYNFVGNNPLSRWDRLGLTCYCAKDITAVLEKTINNMERFYKNGMFTQGIADGMLSGSLGLYFTVDGWDIEMLFNAGKKPDNVSYENRFESKHGMSSPPCDNTVSIHGKCYKISSVNYILWGKLVQLSNRLTGNNKDPLSLIRAYRDILYFVPWNDESENFSMGTNGRQFWADIGFKSNDNMVNPNDNVCILPPLYVPKTPNINIGGIMPAQLAQVEIIEQDPLTALDVSYDCIVDPSDTFDLYMGAWAWDANKKTPVYFD